MKGSWFCYYHNETFDIPKNDSSEQTSLLGTGLHFAHFFPPCLKYVLFYIFSIGLGIHEIPQVISAKIIDEKKKGKKWNKFAWIFSEFCTNLPKFCQSFARISPKIHPQFCLNSCIGKIGGGGHSAPLPPPISYAYGQQWMITSIFTHYTT